MKLPATGDLQGRAVDEWIGSTPDAHVPPTVRLRVFERACGFCHISGRKIMPGDKWDLDHLIPLHKGGEHRENNLAPAIAEAHRRKSAAERRDKAKADRTRKKHIGITRSKNPMPFGRGSRLKRKIGGGVVLRQMEDADS